MNSEEVQTNGLHYVGLWHGFELISKTDQFGEYRITAFTSNAIQVEVEVTIQYQVQPSYENLYKIIFDYDDMGSYFDSRVKDAVRRGIQSLKSDVLYSNRATVTSVLRENVTPGLEACAYTLNNLQVTQIHVPHQMQQAIDDLVDAGLEIEVANNERSQMVQNAHNQKNRQVHEATILADTTLQTAFAEYNKTRKVIHAQLYTLKKNVENVERLILSYQESYPEATDSQIMELIKAHRYNSIISSVASTGTNKVVLDHNPSAIGKVGDDLKQRLDAYPSGLPTTNFYDEL